MPVGSSRTSRRAHMTNLGDKAIDCLRFIADNPRPTYAEWAEAYEALCARWSEKAVDRKLTQLSAEGYIDYGVSPRTGWLEAKGSEALRAHTD